MSVQIFQVNSTLIKELKVRQRSEAKKEVRGQKLEKRSEVRQRSEVRGQKRGAV